ncbi:Ig-like domain-containing protein [Draconibacterium orientale]|uniref:Ig-like domain-containing protein n=1 Tax=Draconibacterium orientale TaxID=1168034 RepID=UPI002ABDFA7B|nr:Ig-like domain-containing protein [Draconibacterium orientale]
MKRIIYVVLFSLALVYVACENVEEPKIPKINDCTISLLNNEGIPISNVWAKLYYTDIKPGFCVDSTYTSVLGGGFFMSLEPREYELKAFSESGEELGSGIIVIEDSVQVNEVELMLDVYVENYDFSISVVDNRDNPIEGRKVALYTSEANPEYVKEGVTDAAGSIVFVNTVVGTYNVYLYDDENTVVFEERESVVEAGGENMEAFVVSKIYHNTKIVITGIMHDPKGSDSKDAGTTSGDGYVHDGEYEYVQLMALADIDFAQEPYAVVFTNSGAPTEYGWADGVYNIDNKKVYQMNLETGSVKKGQYFYVGGSSRRIASYYKLVGSQQLSEDVFWGVNYANEPGGNGNGAPKNGSGLLGNGSGKTVSTIVKSSPDGIAIFEGTSVDENTIPADAVFYGTEVTYMNYQLPNNDIYSRENEETGEAQPMFGQGTNTFLFPVGAQDQGDFIKLGGKVTPTQWLVPRSGTRLRFNLSERPGASVSDIENAEDCTVFVDK